MLAKVYSVALIGLTGHIIEVEVHVAPGMYRFDIVGLPDKSVQEAKARVRSAIQNSGFHFPYQRIAVNLAPADLAKTGAGFDLAIATGILAATGQIKVGEKSIFWGELGLTNETRFTRGALPVADVAKNAGFAELFIPRINANEAGIVAGIDVKPVKNLVDIVNHHAGKKLATYKSKIEDLALVPEFDSDLSQVKGQEQARRAIEIAAAGGHNILFNGTPGSGKTFLARTLVSILPEMEFAEKIEVTKIHSIAGQLNSDKSLISTRPFRNPHHTSSQVSLIGGGSQPKPGEVSLAHRGVLFLDEFNEFSGKSLETLRQPLEDKVVNISRASGVMTFPASFMLVAAMNPCKCGYFGDTEKACICSAYDISKYTKIISGPILDRIDLQIKVSRVKKDEFFAKKTGESSCQVRERVVRARSIQLQRFRDFQRPIYSNSEMNQQQLSQKLFLESRGLDLIKTAIDKLSLTARGYYRTLKVARTIADLENSENVKEAHVAEALSYRLSS